MHNTRGNYSVLPGTGSSWQESCRQGWKEFSGKFTKSQMEKEQNLLSGPAIAKQTERLSICVTLLLEDMRRRWHGGRRRLSWLTEKDLGCFRPVWKPPSLVTLQPRELPSFLAWRCQPDGVPGTIPRQNMARR